VLSYKQLASRTHPCRGTTFPTCPCGRVGINWEAIACPPHSAVSSIIEARRIADVVAIRTLAVA
jgi:hypothetical protein